jgi:hypothetical protein
MEANDNQSQAIRALKVAAFFQAALGAVVTVFGGSGLSDFLSLSVRRVDLQVFIQAAYLGIGSALILIALPLAHRARWAWLASLLLVGALLCMIFVDMISVFSDRHDSEGSLSAFCAVLLGLLPLAPLYNRGRLALIS